MTGKGSAPFRVRLAGLLVRDSRVLAIEHQKDGRRYALLPGGGIEPGEDAPRGLQREFKEELDMDVETGELLLVTESLSPDGSRHILQLVFRVAGGGEPRATFHDGRVSGYRWLSAGDLTRETFYPDIAPWVRQVLEGQELGPVYRRLEWT